MYMYMHTFKQLFGLNIASNTILKLNHILKFKHITEMQALFM